MTCKNIVKREDKCNFCSVRGTAYCELPASDIYFSDESDCSLYEYKEEK